MVIPKRTSWRRLGPRRMRYAVQAFGYLAASRVRFGIVPIGRLLRDLSNGAAVEQNVKRPLDPRLVGWSIAAVSRRLPWRSDCMIQAMAATAWLRSGGYAPTFHLGVRPGAVDDGIEAHAWLTLEGRVVVGGGAITVGDFQQFLTASDCPQDRSRDVGAPSPPA